MWSDFHRLRKLRRRKLRACGPKLAHIMELYWRYHLKVYGPTAHLWNYDQA